MNVGQRLSLQMGSGNVHTYNHSASAMNVGAGRILVPDAVVGAKNKTRCGVAPTTASTTPSARIAAVICILYQLQECNNTEITLSR